MCWITWRGRRFGCYKVRKNRGIRGTQWRLKGSDKAVQLRQRAATAALLRHAARDEAAPGEPTAPRNTIFGEPRETLLDGVRSFPDPAPTRKVRNFRARTALRLREKAQFATRGVWVGHRPGEPKLRLGGGVGVRTASCSLAATQARHVVESRLWRPRRSSSTASSCPATESASASAPKRPPVRLEVVDTSAKAADEGTRYKQLEPAAIARADALVVDALDDLDKYGKTDSRIVMAWLHVIASGKSVLQADDPEKKKVQYQPASQQVKAKVRFTDTFRCKHPSLQMAFANISTKKGSKWEMVKSVDKGNIEIANLSAFQDFLCRVRRLDAPQRYGRYRELEPGKVGKGIAVFGTESGSLGAGSAAGSAAEPLQHRRASLRGL